MEILQVFQTKNRSYSVKKTPIKPIGIMAHSTGTTNKYLKRWVDAEERLGKNQYNNHWNKPEAKKSMHAFIGYDKYKKIIVAQTLPYDCACWGAGGGKKGCYNYNPHAYIQFEICQSTNVDKDYYWQVIAVAEEYCAYLCKQFGWTAANITSHKEAALKGYASNHSDPIKWMKHFGDDMDKFRSRVAARLGENSPTIAPEIIDGGTDGKVDKAAENANLEGKTVNIAMTVIRSGNRGNEVKTAQRLLNALGYDCGTVDGVFGNKTKTATIAFQNAKKLDADGIIGKATWTALLK